MPLETGTRLGNYEIVAPIGAGGMGEVYRAHDPRLGRDVALKVLPQGFASDPARLARFEREARMAAGINHPNVVVLHSIEEADGVRFLTMELVEGQGLERLIGPDLPIPRVLEMGLALAEALAAAHDRGIVHRDLKPSNVMVNEQGRLKVLDFGLAKLDSVRSSDLTLDMNVTATTPGGTPVSHVGEMVGTLPYMAPEQLLGETVDARADLFALGVILHELATGQRPFTGRSFAEVTSAILRDAPAPPSRIRPDVPAGFDAVVARCLEKQPERRYSHARDLRDALEALRHVSAVGMSQAPHAVAEPVDSGPSIAVMPFVNMSQDPENEYFSDGLTEELMNMLVKTPGLRVAARTSSFHFKGRNPSLAEVGRALDVATVLEGSVRKAGDRVRISVRLVKVADGYPLWSETFERRLDDIFAVQDDVAQAVVAALPGSLLPGTAEPAAGRGTSNREAYDAYLEGRFYWNKRTEADARSAIGFFERALALDPAFAEAWGGIADCYVTLPFYSLTPAPEALQKARDAARRALELRPDLGSAHASLAYALMVDLKWPEAEQEFRRAIELSPGDANAHKWYTDLLLMTGRRNAALREVRRALELDPLSASIWTIMGEWHWHEEQLDEAMAAYRKALELTPTLPLALELAARLCWQRGDVEQYFTLRERLEAVSQRVAVSTAELRQAFARGGRTEVLRAQLSAPVARLLPTDRARWHAELGDLDAAFRDLDDSLAQRELRLPYATYFADFAPLWKDPRFDDLLLRMGVR